LTLYADILFLVNFAMNGFVLWVLSKAMRVRLKWYRVAAGAGLMALLYTLIIVAERLRHVNVLLASLVILAAGVIVAFRPFSRNKFLNSFRNLFRSSCRDGESGRRSGYNSGFNSEVLKFFKLMVVAYVISFTVGGLGMSLFFLTGLPYAVYFISEDFNGFLRTVSWQLVLVGTLISYVLIKFSLKMAERYTLKRQLLCNVRISVGDADCNFDALVDTGHSLKEPLSQSPVIIAEFEQIKPLLPDGLKVLFYEKQENNLTEFLSAGEESFRTRIRMIPFSSLGRNHGMLIGFRPDNVNVTIGEAGEKSQKTTNAVIGIYNDKLCRDGRYRGLLSPELVA